MCSTVTSIVTSPIHAATAVVNCTTGIVSRVGSAVCGIISSPIQSTRSLASGVSRSLASGVSGIAAAVCGIAIPYIRGYGAIVISNAAWAIITISVGTALLAGRHILDLNLIVAGTTAMGATAIAVATAASVGITALGMHFVLEPLDVPTETLYRDWLWVAALPVFGVAYMAAVPLTTVIFSTALGALGLYVKAATVGFLPDQNESREIRHTLEREADDYGSTQRSSYDQRGSNSQIRGDGRGSYPF